MAKQPPVLRGTPKQVNRKVSHLPGVQGAVRAQAEQIGARAGGLLASHRETGDHHIEVEHRVGASGAPSARGVDSQVNLVGTAPGALELGHVTKAGKWVGGIHVLKRASGG